MNILETQNLTKRYHRHERGNALDRVTLALPAGRIAGLVGRNGSGKTTLLHTLTGLVLPTEGTALALGQPVAKLEAAQLSQLGFVPQTPRFLEWMTGTDYLRYLATYYERWDTARQAALIRDLEFSADKQIAKLTPGDRQKLSFISAVCHHPKLLLLDEPSSALDPIVREQFLKTLLDLAREDDATVLISSHLLHDVEKIVDWVICLDAGQLIVSSPLDELQERYAVWIVTATDATTALPVKYNEPYILQTQVSGPRARLLVRDPAQHAAEFTRTHHVAIESHPLTLEQLFPLLISPSTVKPAAA